MVPPDRSESLPANFRFERVDLSVADLERSRGFYRDVVGLEERPIDGLQAQADDVLDFGTVDGTLLRLSLRSGVLPSPRRASGLYHVALLLPDRPSLARFAHHLADGQHAVVGASDHAVSEAIYLQDPDGHGLEVYRDRPEAEWPYTGGELAMRTDPLNVPDLLSALQPEVAKQIWTAPAGTRIGHVHLRVRDVDEARRFYVDAVGFDETAGYPGASFLSVGGYHHHLGVNAWESAGRDGPGDEVARLLAVRGSLESSSAVAELRARLGDSDDGDAADFRDPSGTRWIVAAG